MTHQKLAPSENSWCRHSCRLGSELLPGRIRPETVCSIQNWLCSVQNWLCSVSNRFVFNKNWLCSAKKLLPASSERSLPIFITMGGRHPGRFVPSLSRSRWSGTLESLPTSARKTAPKNWLLPKNSWCSPHRGQSPLQTNGLPQNWLRSVQKAMRCQRRSPIFSSMHKVHKFETRGTATSGCTGEHDRSKQNTCAKLGSFRRFSAPSYRPVPPHPERPEPPSEIGFVSSKLV